MQAWLDRYLKHRTDDSGLLGATASYLEPRGRGVWAPVTLDRPELLSFYYCSAYAFHSGSVVRSSPDAGGVGGCAP